MADSVRKRGLRASRQSTHGREPYSIPFDEIPVALLETDRQGALVRLNRAACRLLGVEEEAVAGRRASELWTPGEDATGRERSPDDPAAPTRKEYRRSDGSRLVLEIRKTPIHDRTGAGSGVRLTLLDATAPEQTREQLKRAELRFTAFMDHLPGIAFVKDAAGRYIYLNGAMAELAGQPAEAVLGRTDAEIWPPETAAALATGDRRALEGRQPLETFDEFPQQGGVRTWLVHRFPVPGRAGAPELVGGVGVDVTDRKLLEDQLRQSQKMDAVGRLAGGVAHDFNNLLTIIGGYGRMVLDQLGPDDRARASMESIVHAADRAAVLTSQLLVFSRRQVVQPKLLELNHVVSNLEKMLRRVIGEHIALSTELDPNLERVKCDAGQIEQVIMNLAINARDAMPKGGRLTIETANAALAGRAEPQVRLSVIDTGVGMDEQTLGRLFEPFFTTKERGKGAGLGLSTVYGIVKQHGGEIRVESHPGAGSRFDLYLPAAEERARSATPGAFAQAASRGNETILLVEDEAGVRRLARDVLRAAGYRVLEAADGHAALRIAESESAPIHLLLTDMVLPLMSGRELAGRLGSQGPINVIFMSGYTNDVIAYHGDLGPDAHFLQKPFAPDALTTMVRQVLDAGRSQTRPAGR